MKKTITTLALAFVVLSALLSAEVQVTFNVDLNFSTYVPSNKVWIVFGIDEDENFINPQKMSDTDGDRIFSYTTSIDLGDEATLVQPYSFIYSPSQAQNSKAWAELDLPGKCSNSDYFREVELSSGVTDTVLPAFIHSRCDYVEGERSKVTFRLDVKGVESFVGPFCSIEFNKYDAWVFMEDMDGDSIFEVTLNLPKGANYKYIYSVQDGANDLMDWNTETVPESCASNGQRVLMVSDHDMVLDMCDFGQCADGSSAIRRLQDESLTRIFPNPCKDVLTVAMAREQNVELEMLSLSGAVVYQHLYTKTKDIKLDLTSMPSGVYLLLLTCDGGSIVHRVLVEQ